MSVLNQVKGTKIVTTTDIAAFAAGTTGVIDGNTKGITNIGASSKTIMISLTAGGGLYVGDNNAKVALNP